MSPAAIKPDPTFVLACTNGHRTDPIPADEAEPKVGTMCSFTNGGSCTKPLVVVETRT